MVIYQCLPNNKNMDTLKFKLSLAQGLVEKHGSAVPHPVYGCPLLEPPPKRLTVTFLGAYSRHRKEGKISKRMYSVRKTCQKEGIDLLV
jgi:hypothetical protein